MPFIGNFFYPDKVEMAPTPNLGDMIAKAVQMRRANEAAKMQAERDKMGMELDRMKLSGMVESQKKEKAMATSFGELAKAYQASQGGPSKLPDATPNFAALYGSTPGMGAMGLPGVIPTTVATQGMNQAMSIEDLQKQMFLKVAEMGNPKDQLGAIQALVPQQRGRSAEDQMMIDKNRFQQDLIKQKNKLDASVAAFQESAKFKDRSREDSQTHAANMQALQINAANYRTMLGQQGQYNRQSMQQFQDEQGNWWVRPSNSSNAQPLTAGGAVPPVGGMTTMPMTPDMDIGNVQTMPVTPDTPRGTMTPLYSEGAPGDDSIVGMKVGQDPNALITPPASMPTYDPKTGQTIGTVDDGSPMGTVTPVAPGIPQEFSPAPESQLKGPPKAKASGDDKALKTIWWKDPIHVASRKSAESGYKVRDLMRSISQDVAAGKPTSVKQLVTLWNTIQSIDQSVVKEGEVSMFQGAQGLRDQVSNYVSRWGNGEQVQMLSPQALAEFSQVADLMISGADSLYRRNAAKFNYNFGREVVPSMPYADPAGAGSPAPQQAATGTWKKVKDASGKVVGKYNEATDEYVPE